VITIQRSFGRIGAGKTLATPQWVRESVRNFFASETRCDSTAALIFLHIPKTAGTTLNRIIEWQYDPRLIFTVDPHRFRATVKRFHTFSEERRRSYQVLRGHLVYGIHEFLPQRATYITMLRDPVSRFLSSYQFILRRPLHPLHQKMKRQRLGPEDLIRLTPQSQNLQCRFISGIGKGGKCDERILEMAKANLKSSFRVVGLTERFHESLLLMIAAFGWKVPFYQNQKVAKVRPAIDAGLAEFIRKHNRLDVELYRFGEELFEAQLRENQEVVARLSSVLSSREPMPLAKFCYSSAGLGRFLTSKVASAL
jgi:galactose-3-O-sulfotransferase